jgi:RNA-directed DNA polymerase
MKRYGNLYSKIYNIENIRLAHHNARKGKKHYDEVKLVDANPDFYFEQIHRMLKDKTFRNSKYHVFKRKFGNKEREIFKLPYFPDRIIHHCIMQVLEPIWKKTLIRDTYSSIKGRGLHDGVRRVKQALKDVAGTQYCLKLDIKKFYPSVDHDVLKQIIRKKIKCIDTLWLLDEIIDSTSGVPIGNYLSQYFGNIYLSSLDHFVKEHYKAKHYFRYCDDIVILAQNKQRLRRTLMGIIWYCKEIKLTLKGNYQIFPVDNRGIDFLGYRFFHDYVLLRKSIVKRFKEKIFSINNSWTRTDKQTVVNGIMSYWGWIKHGDCKTLFDKYIDFHIRAITEACCLLLNQRNPLRRLQ